VTVKHVLGVQFQQTNKSKKTSDLCLARMTLAGSVSKTKTDPPEESDSITTLQLEKNAGSINRYTGKTNAQTPAASRFVSLFFLLVHTKSASHYAA
jgi:hypothetical protein